MAGNRKSFLSWLRLTDWRIWIITGAVFVALAGTGVIYWLGIGRDPATHFGAVFASWVGAVAVFVLAALGAIVSLAKPESESFESRARILFRRQTGAHIDYIVQQMRGKFEHYAESNTSKITIKEYNAAEKKFFVSSQDTMILRSYIDDEETVWASYVDYKGLTPPPATGRPNRLVFVRINDVTLPSSEQVATDGAIHMPVNTTVKKNDSCKVEYLAEYWVLADTEDNTHKTIRYNQLLTVDFESEISAPVSIQVIEDGKEPITHKLAQPGDKKRAIAISGLVPGKQAYNFHIVAP
jgi:hypothetical protein